jgi:hypothetical protein
MFKCSCDDIFRLIRKVYKILRILPNIMDSSFLPLLYDLCFVSLWLFRCFFEVASLFSFLGGCFQSLIYSFGVSLIPRPFHPLYNSLYDHRLVDRKVLALQGLYQFRTGVFISSMRWLGAKLIGPRDP